MLKLMGKEILQFHARKFSLSKPMMYECCFPLHGIPLNSALQIA